MAEETKVSIPVNEVKTSETTPEAGVDLGGVVSAGMNLFKKSEPSIQKQNPYLQDILFDISSHLKGTAEAAPLAESIINTYGYNKTLDLLSNPIGIKWLDNAIDNTGFREKMRQAARKPEPDMTKFEDNDFVKTMSDIQKSSDYLSRKYQGENFESLVNKAMSADSFANEMEVLSEGGPIAISMGTQASAKAWGDVSDYMTHQIVRGFATNAAPIVASLAGHPEISAALIAESGISAAGRKYSELRKNAPEMKEEDRINNAVMTGALQFIMQKVALNLTAVGSKIIAKAGVNIGSTIIKNSITQNLQQGMGEAFAKVAGLEVAGNTLNGMANYLATAVLDNVYHYNVQSWKELMYGLIESGVISAAHGLIIQAPAAMTRGYSEAMQIYKQTGNKAALPTMDEILSSQALIDIHGKGYKDYPPNVLTNEQALASAMLEDMYKGGIFSEDVKALENVKQAAEHVKGKVESEEGYVRMAGGHSTLEDVINSRIPGRATPEQILKTLENAGVSKEEVQDMDLFNWLKGKEIVTKKDLKDYLSGNDIQIHEISKVGENTPSTAWGDAKFANYQLPGGENYREVLLTLPVSKEQANVIKGVSSAEMADPSHPIQEVQKQVFMGSHWSEPNVLAHFRLNDRTIDGKKTLFIEEIQSDWHQQGREKGYKSQQDIDKNLDMVIKKAVDDDDLDSALYDVQKAIGVETGDLAAEFFSGREDEWDNKENRESLLRDYINEERYSEWASAKEGVPNAPFKKTWHELALKRILRMAAEEGYDKIAWTTGEQQAERYDLSRQVDYINIKKNSYGEWQIKAGKKDQKLPSVVQSVKDVKDIDQYVGKEIGDKFRSHLDEGGKEDKTFEGDALKVGGHGMRGFYDQIIPQFLNKYTKKWGGRVSEGNIEAGMTTEFDDETPSADIKTVHTLELTPAMKSAIMKSQPIYGTQARPTGQEGFARVNKPEGWEPEGEERKLVTSVKESERTADQVRKSLESYYNPITNKDTLAQAHKEIQADRTKVINEVLDPKSDVTALSNAKALILAHQLQKEGNFDQAIQIIETTAQKATELGQAVQALSLYSHLTPEGVLVYAQRKINEANKLKQSKGDFKNPIKLTKEKAEELQKAAEEIKDAKSDKERVIKTALLQKKIADIIPATIWQKISTVQTMSQLLNAKTTLRNLIGNLGFQTMENIKDSVATGFDIMVSGFTGIRTKTLPDPMQQWKSLKEGWQDGVQDAVYGINTGQATKFDFAQRKVFDKGVLSHLEKTMNILLRAPDRAFYKAAHDASLLEQMKVAKVKFPTEEMLNQAHIDGLYRTFQDDSALARLFTGVKKALNLKGEFGLGDFIIKYPRTPANIISRGIEYTPLNFINTMWELGKLTRLGKNIKNTQDKTITEFATKTQRRASESFGRALTGSSLLVGTGYLLSALGIMTGTEPKNKDKDLKAMEKEIGLGKQKINVSAVERTILSGFNPDAPEPRQGDVYVTYDWFQPQAINLALGANLHQNRGIESKTSAFLDALLTSADTIIDQPLFMGIRKLFGFNDPVQGITDIFKDIPASFVPTFLSQTAKFIDNTARNTSDESPFKEAMNRVQYKIPYWSGKLEPRINIWGEDEKFGKDQGQLGRFFETFISPYFSSKLNETPEDKLALDIWLKSGIKDHFPQIASRNQNIVVREKGQPINKTVTLEPKNYTEFQRYIGHKTGVLYHALTQNESFQRLPADEQASKIREYLSAIVTSAKVLYAGHRPEKLSKKAKSLTISGAKEQGIDLRAK